MICKFSVLMAKSESDQQARKKRAADLRERIEEVKRETQKLISLTNKESHYEH